MPSHPNPIRKQIYRSEYIRRIWGNHKHQCDWTRDTATFQWFHPFLASNHKIHDDFQEFHRLGFYTIFDCKHHFRPFSQNKRKRTKSFVQIWIVCFCAFCRWYVWCEWKACALKKMDIWIVKVVSRAKCKWCCLLRSVAKFQLPNKTNVKYRKHFKTKMESSIHSTKFVIWIEIGFFVWNFASPNDV